MQVNIDTAHLGEVHINDPTQRCGNFIIARFDPVGYVTLSKREAIALRDKLQLCISDMPEDDEYDADGMLKTLPNDDTVLAAEAVTDA